MGPAWLCVSWLRNRYAAKRSSDLLLIGNAIWLLMALVIWNRAVQGSRCRSQALAAALPWIAWRLTLLRDDPPGVEGRAGARADAAAAAAASTALGGARGGCSICSAPAGALLGSIDLIAAPDLASRTVEPSTFLEFVRGRLKRLFIRSPGRSQAAHREPRRQARPRRALPHQPAVLLRRHVEGRRHPSDGNGIAGRHGPARLRSAPPRLRLRARDPARHRAARPAGVPDRLVDRPQRPRGRAVRALATARRGIRRTSSPCIRHCGCSTSAGATRWRCGNCSRLPSSGRRWGARVRIKSPFRNPSELPGKSAQFGGRLTSAR